MNPHSRLFRLGLWQCGVHTQPRGDSSDKHVIQLHCTTAATSQSLLLLVSHHLCKLCGVVDGSIPHARITT